MTTVFTIGYEQRDPERLVAELHAAGVEVLVDVRELPLSRRRGFSKTALATRLEVASIRYEHMRPLGNPKPLRELCVEHDERTCHRSVLVSELNRFVPSLNVQHL